MTQLQFDPMKELPPDVKVAEARSGVWAAAALAALGIGFALWLYLRPTHPAQSPVVGRDENASDSAQPAAPRRSTSASEPAMADPSLPDLAQSDDFVRALVAELFGSPELDNWFAAGEEFVHRGVRAILAISEQRSARRFLDFLPLAGRFETSARGESRIIAAESYRRYDRLVDIFVSLDSEQLARLVERLGPLLSLAMDENALPGTDFGTTLEAAIDHLLATPVPAGELEVLAGEDGVYRFADPRLEALSPPQKQLLRLGPGNGARVRAKVQELKLVLGAPQPR